MMQNNLFSESHPAVLFFYFFCVIAVTMFTAHPVVLGISFIGAFSYRMFFKKRKAFFRDQFLFMFPLFFFFVFFNAAFNHYGVTPLYYLKTGAITLESIVYGAVLGGMLWASILWFSSVNLLFTTDKLVYLFGRFFPSMGLFLSMVFRFVPRFRHKWQMIREGQAYLGRDIRQQRYFGKIRCAIAEISILLTWAFESSVTMVDSMYARGYGTGKRTFYRRYMFSFWDKCIAAIGLLLFVFSIVGFHYGVGKSQYDPWISLGGFPVSLMSLAAYLTWSLFCFYPVLVSAAGEMIYRSREKRSIRQVDGG